MTSRQITVVLIAMSALALCALMEAREGATAGQAIESRTLALQGIAVFHQRREE